MPDAITYGKDCTYAPKLEKLPILVKIECISWFWRT